MSLLFARGSRTEALSADDLRAGLSSALETLQNRGLPCRRVLVIPPDHTRFDSRAGEITCMAYDLLGDRIKDILPALGTHAPMEEKELQHMFPTVPQNLFRPHRWREDVVTLGEVPSEFVQQATEGIYDRPWPAQVNRLLVEGGHDLMLSIGQVVPHEVIGMANYNKNIFVGTGGYAGINESHYLSALYGMERIMGRCDTPLRKILNRASDLFCCEMPIIYIQTVIESLADGRKITRGLFIGESHDVFFTAGKLAAEVNCTRLDEAPKTVVVTMDPAKYKRTWLANKAIYRTRMAVATGGKLIIIAPGVKEFGEDPEIDRLIRKYGYRTTPEVLKSVEQNEDLRSNLSAAAHLIHGSSENRFQVFYAPGQMTQQEVESVGYQYAKHEEMTQRYRVGHIDTGWHQTEDGEKYYFIKDPGLGLWMHKDHPSAAPE